MEIKRAIKSFFFSLFLFYILPLFWSGIPIFSGNFSLKTLLLIFFLWIFQILFYFKVGIFIVLYLTPLTYWVLEDFEFKRILKEKFPILIGTFLEGILIFLRVKYFVGELYGVIFIGLIVLYDLIFIFFLKRLSSDFTKNN